MAGPLQEMLSSLRQRRQQRQGGWAGGDSPGMRDIISPLDSQGMTDRAQGVDISSSMPATRLEARMAPAEDPQPTGGAALTAQLTGGRPQVRTAAGSGGAPDATREAGDCANGQCGVRQSGGLDASQYGITLGPGERLLSVSPQAGGATASAGQASAAPASAAPASGPNPADAWGEFTNTFKSFADDPASASWTNLAKINAQQASAFNNLANMSPDIATKHFYRKQAVMFGMEALNATKAAILQADSYRRESFAQQRLERDTIGGQTGELMDFLTADNPEMTPDFKAATYVGRYRNMVGLPPFKTVEEMQADPDYQDARQIAHASRIAGLASSAIGSGEPTAWGTEESRAAGMSMAWEAARSYYGSMPLSKAAGEIKTRFTPIYLRELNGYNATRPESERLSPVELQRQASQAATLLLTHLAMSQPKAQQPNAAPAKAPHPYLSRSSFGGGVVAPRAAPPASPAPAQPAEPDPSMSPSRASFLMGGR